MSFGKVIYEDFENLRADGFFTADFRKIENKFSTAINKIAASKVDAETVTAMLVDSSHIALNILETDHNSEAAEVSVSLLQSFFEVLDNRAEMVVKFQDLACRFENCSEVNYKSVATQTMGLLASLTDRDELYMALQHVDLVPEKVVDVFKRIHEKYNIVLQPIFYGNGGGRLPGLNAKFKEAATSKERIDALRSFSPYSSPQILARLVTLIQKARSYIDDRLSKTLKVENILDFNPSLATAKQIVSHSAFVAGKLKDRLDEYKNQRVSVLRLLAQNVEVETQQLNFERNALSLQLAEAVNDLNSLESSLTEKNTRFAEYLAQIGNVKSNEHFSSYAKSQIDNGVEWFTIHAHNAPHNENDPIQGARMITSSSSGNGGPSTPEVVAITVNGNWSPTCALGKSEFASYADKQVEVGPEGYYISFAKGGAEIDSHTSSKREVRFSEESTRIDACLRASTPGSNVGVSGSSCASFAKGKRKEQIEDDSHSTISEDRYSASFSAGLRLPDTPFTQFPAGSLLAITLPEWASHSSDAVDIQVVDRSTTIFCQIIGGFILLLMIVRVMANLGEL